MTTTVPRRDLESLLDAISQALAGKEGSPLPNAEGRNAALETALDAPFSSSPMAALASGRNFDFLERSVSTLRERIGRLQRTLDHKSARLDTLERDAAQVEQLQNELCLKNTPQIPGFRIQTLNRSADRISGDFIDVAPAKGGAWALSIADVTGHGSVAGQLGLLVRSALRCARGIGRDPRRSLLRLNRDLLSLELSEHPFVAALSAILYPETKILRWARCGTPYPLLVRRGKDALVLKSRGTLLGCVTKPDCEVMEHRLELGDAALLATDGLENLLSPSQPTDWQNSAWYKQLPCRSISASLGELAIMLNSREPSTPLDDDVSVVVVERVD